MSDSEDEAAFASADEGEVTKKASPKKSGIKESSEEVEKKDRASGQTKSQKKKGKKGKKNETKKPQPSKPLTEGNSDLKTEVPDKPETKQEKLESEKSEKAKSTEKTEPPKEKKETKDIKSDGKPEHQKENPKAKEDAKVNNPEQDTPKPNQAEKPESTVKEDSKSKTPEKSPPPPQVDSPSTQSIPRTAGEREVTPEAEQTEPTQKSSGGWGWGSWGSSLLTAASSSVSTFTSQVGEGFNTIVDSVESSLGAPPPEEIARVEAERQEEEKDKDTERSREGKTSESDDKSPEDKSEGAEGGGGGGGWFSTLGVSSITSKIQNTGKSLVSGSLDAVEALATGSIDVLENIGKKTIGVLSEHDPGFKKTRSTLFEHGEKKQNLSVLLREAKEQAEQDAVLREEQEEARKHNYGAVFDDFQGLAHLEALEILSNQSEKKVQALLSSLPPDTISQLKPQLLQIKELFELDDSDYEDRKEHDFSKLITDLLSELHLGTTPDKLNKVQEKNRQWIITFYAEPGEGEEKAKVEPKEIFHAAISALAELTAKSVEQFHKAGELILMQKDSDTSFEKRSKSLSCLTQVLCTEVTILSTKFTQCLHKVAEDMEDTSVITPFVTNVYLEASNSSTYIQDGFQLLLPVLQQAAIQNSPLLQS